MNPLDPLRDIQLPPSPGPWPPAIGWWLLAGALLGAIAIGLWFRRRRRREAYRRAALEELEGLEGLDTVSVAAIMALIRRTARAANSANDWASLPAGELLSRVDAALGGALDRDLKAAGGDLAGIAESQYRPAENLDSNQVQVLARHAREWIRRHRKGSLC